MISVYDYWLSTENVTAISPIIITQYAADMKISFSFDVYYNTTTVKIKTDKVPFAFDDEKAQAEMLRRVFRNAYNTFCLAVGVVPGPTGKMEDMPI